jgi:hypothetical protein
VYHEAGSGPSACSSTGLCLAALALEALRGLECPPSPAWWCGVPPALSSRQRLGSGDVKHNTVHSVETLPAKGEGTSCATRPRLPSALCRQPQLQLRGRFWPCSGGCSDSARCASSLVGCSPKFPFSVKVKTVQLCFLKPPLAPPQSHTQVGEEAIVSAGSGQACRQCAQPARPFCLLSVRSPLKDSLLMGLLSPFLMLGAGVSLGTRSTSAGSHMVLWELHTEPQLFLPHGKFPFPWNFPSWL